MDIPSLVQKKYAYGVGEEFNTATYYLFSDQSPLGFSVETEKHYDNFYELLCHEELKLDDYPEYCIPQIRWLVDHNYLFIDPDNYISFCDERLIILLNDLFYNEVINYWMLSREERTILDTLESRNIIEFESTLLSRPEYGYFNYYLNKAQYSNGLDLRNKYSHTQPNTTTDNENMHMRNYMIFLRLFVIAIIKINDDFCLAEKVRFESNTSA